MAAKIHSPWCERNQEPILRVLQRLLGSVTGTMLEIGSGSGQHAAYFACHLSHLRWQPSDHDESKLASIQAWAAEAELPNLAAPMVLDVRQEDWGVGKVDAIFSANMIHIAPWECCLALLAGARRHLADRGLLILYGPFRVNGRHTADSNQQFDTSLRNRDPRWGIRDLKAVRKAAVGLELEDRVLMPANNLTLVFRRQQSRQGPLSV